MASSKLPSDDKPDWKDEIRKSEGLSKDTSNKESKGFYSNKDSGEEPGVDSSNPESAFAAEQGYFRNESDDKATARKAKLKKGLVELAKGHRRKAIFTLATGGGIVGIVISLFLLMIPLKIEYMVKNLENHFFSASNFDVATETDKLTKDWMTGPLAGAMKSKCTSKVNSNCCSVEGRFIVSKDCKINVTGSASNPVANLYRTWSQAKLENNFADKGIELKYDTSGSGTFYLKAPGLSGDVKVGDGVSGIGPEFAAVDRGTVRQTFLSAEKDLTGWDKIMYRYKVGRLLEQKYGIKRCVVYCGQRDAFADSVSNKKYAAKLFLMERVITPRNAALGAVIGCLINVTSTSCSDKAPDTTCTEATCEELAGAPQTEADTEVESALAKISATLGDETAKKLISKISEVKDSGGLTNYVIKQIITQAFGQDVADKAIPIIGQIQTVIQASHIISAISNAPATIKKLSYLTNATAAVSLYMTYRSYADEVHTGHVDPTELGSFTNSLGPGSQCQPEVEGNCNSQLGGTADASGSPLYGYIMNNQLPSGSSSSASSMLDLFPSAYADSSIGAGSETYLCNGGSPVPSGKLVCPEEELGQSNAYVTALSEAVKPFSPLTDFINNYSGIVSTALNIISNTVSSLVTFVLKHTPGVSSLMNLAQKYIGQVLIFFANKLVPTPFGLNMSGGRTFDMMAAGADVSGNNYAHTGLGGHMLTAAQVSTIINTQQSQAMQQFSQRPLFARIFSTSTPYSLVSRLALVMPYNLTSFGTSITSFITWPFTTISNAFSSIMSPKVSAASPPVNDPFGVIQYGYTQSDLDSITNPQQYWDQNCTDNPATAYQKDNSWNTEAANYDTSNSVDTSGESINTSTNPCLLLESVVGEAGGIYNTSLLTSSDLADTGGSNSGGGQSTCSGGSGNYSALVGSGSSFAGVDQGIDFVPSATSGFDVCAPASGTITLADQTGHQYTRTNGQALVIEQLDQNPNVSNGSQYVYFAELLQINSSITVGAHVSAGQVIGHVSQSPGIETGWGLSPTQGFMCPLGAQLGSPTPCGQSFNTWIQGLSGQPAG